MRELSIILGKILFTTNGWLRAGRSFYSVVKAKTPHDKFHKPVTKYFWTLKEIVVLIMPLGVITALIRKENIHVHYRFNREDFISTTTIVGTQAQC